MPVLDINGTQVAVGEEFLKLSPEQQQATVEEIAGSLGGKPTFDRSDPRFSDSGAGAAKFLEGIPVLGGLVPQAGAAISAAAQPLTSVGSKGETFKDRYAKNLIDEQASAKALDEERPIASTALKMAGGVAGTLPLVLAAPKVMGAMGTLPQMIRRGATSGAALTAADAAVRGEDVPTGAAVGGAFGAGAPLVARAIGATARLVAPKTAPVAAHEFDVAGVKVPMRPDQITGDVAAAARAEEALHGTQGARAQQVAKEFEDAQTAAMAKASDNIAASLDPSGTVARTTPQVAGGRVVDELVDAETRRLGTEQATAARAVAEGQQLRQDVAAPSVVGPVQPRLTVESPFEAAEAVGAGVAGRRDASVARTKGLYGEVKETPGAFDPDFVQGMSGNVRTRIATGDDPIFIDPQTAGKGNEALRILDSLDGMGLFKNAAARPGPVAEAAAAGSEAERTLAKMVAQGINPERARAAVANMPGANKLGTALDAHDVALPNGASVRVQPKVIEARSIRTSADDGYDKSLQPRDRSRAASGVQVNDIARNLNPARLGVSSEADRGAPIIGPDRMTESGNGRVLGIRQAYAENGPAAERYRAWLQSQGVDVSKYREPILVRERVTAMNREERKAFTVAANQSATLSLSAPERALADSRLLRPDTLGLIRNPADLGAAENREFVRAFMQGVPASERGALMTASGELSSEGLTRVRNSVLAKAYGDTPVLSRVAEAASDDIKSISNGLMAAAPEWAILRSRIAAGEVPAALDVTGDLIDAVSRTARIRGKGQGLAESHAQADAFAAQSAESQALQRLFYGADGKSAAPGAQIGNALRHYAQEAAKVDAAPGLNLGLKPVTAADVLKGTSGKVGAPAELAAEVRAAMAEAPAAKGAAIPEVGLRDMDSARKRLVALYGDARRAAMGPGGQQSDVRAMGRILQEFDNAIIEAFEGGRFSGDSVLAARLLKDARASHAQYRQTFTSRGGQDEVGRNVEKILGRYGDTSATPDEIMKLSYGSASDPGGGKAAKVAQRLRSILGLTSPEWGAYKQGLLSYVDDASLSFARRAERIERFLDGANGKTLAGVVLSAEERTALRGYAINLKVAEPSSVSALNSVETIIAKISGRQGGIPMSPGETADLIMGRNTRTNKALAVPLAHELKRRLSPESWTGVRQAVWERIINAGDGRAAFGPQMLSRRISEFMDLDVAKVYFAQAELAQMAVMAKAYRQMIPPARATNPSKSSYSVARIANRASHNLMAMLGAATHGFPGLAGGYLAEKGLRGLADSRNAKAAVKGFYGPQPSLPGRSSRVPIVLSQAAAPQVANQ